MLALPSGLRPAVTGAAPFLRVACVAAAMATFLLVPATGVFAQDGAKLVSVDAVPAAPAVARWADSIGVVPLPAAGANVEVLPLPLPIDARAAGATYEPWPVVLGVPELPLLGSGASQAGQRWSGSFNYQALHLRLLAIDSAGRATGARALSTAPRAGERFKLRIAATFDAVAQVSLVVGAPYAARLAGQIYPEPGYSVQLLAGEVVDLPLEPDRCFVMGADPHQRLLLQVRAPAADEHSRSRQPAYRQDGSAGSNFLQLVPPGSRPAFEQLLVVAPL